MDQQEPVRDESADGRTQSAERRRALLRLGIATAAAYVAPTVLSIDRPAFAGPSCAKNPKKC